MAPASVISLRSMMSARIPSASSRATCVDPGPTGGGGSDLRISASESAEPRNETASIRMAIGAVSH